MNDSDLASRILEYVNTADYRPVKPRVIAKKLGLPQSKRPDVRKAVKRLVKKGKLSYGSGPRPFGPRSRTRTRSPVDASIVWRAGT